MIPPEHKILISPIGEWDSDLIKLISEKVQRAFGFQTKILQLIKDKDMDFAFDPKRDQYHSTKILEKLARAAPPLILKVLAITEVDLFIPILTHVYGEAQLGGKTSIISTHRLNKGSSLNFTKKTFLNRVVKEAIHELGHTFKLLHCKEKTCIMHYCRNVNDVDRKSDQLCRYCTIMLNDEIKRLEF